MWQTVSTACWRILQECSTLLRCKTYQRHKYVHIHNPHEPYMKVSLKQQYLNSLVCRAWQCSSAPCVMILTTGASTTSSWSISGKSYCDVDVDMWISSNWHPVRKRSPLVIDIWRNMRAQGSSTIMKSMHTVHCTRSRQSIFSRNRKKHLILICVLMHRGRLQIEEHLHICWQFLGV